MTSADRKLADRAYEHGARHTYPIMDACRRYGVQFSLALAVCEQESEWANVFGHDPTTSIPESWKGGKVTRLRYAYYKLRRRGHGAQGVGPFQLTYGPLQDEADARGGCWQPAPNIDVGVQTIGELIGQHAGDLHAAVAAFNGTGPAAQTYASTVLRRRDRWHGLLA